MSHVPVLQTVEVLVAQTLDESAVSLVQMRLAATEIQGRPREDR